MSSGLLVSYGCCFSRYITIQVALIKIKDDTDVYLVIYPQNMKLEVEIFELTSIIASLGKSSRYFEEVANDQRTADWLMKIRLFY
jgi:hypothetical protein